MSEETPMDPKDETPQVAPVGCEGCQKPPSRRDFLFKLGLGLNVVAGAMVGIPVIGYALSSFKKSPPLKWITLGEVNAFTEGETQLATFENPYKRSWDGETANLPCYVRRIEGDKFQVFAINCAHLGCPVRWFSESKLFMCPCHGGVYYQDGSRASGPPPRGLFEYSYKVENGQLMVSVGVMPTLANPV